MSQPEQAIPNMVIFGVVDGGVTLIEKYFTLRGERFNALKITRDAGGEITCVIGNPEGSGSSTKSQAPEVVFRRFSARKRLDYTEAMGMVHPTKEKLKKLLARHFGRNFQVTFGEI